MKFNYSFIIIQFLFITSCLLAISTQAIALEWSTFSTKGHPKANCLNISVRYPSYFSIRDGYRPNVIQVFTPNLNSGDFNNVITLLISEIPSELLSLLNFNELSDVDLFEYAYYSVKNLDPNAKIISASRIRHENQYGIMFVFIYTLDRAGLTITV